MLTVILSYTISLFVIVFIGWAGEFIVIFITTIFNRIKVVFIIFRFIYTSFLSFISVYILSILLHVINYPVSILMIIFPMLLNISYDRSRIQKVKAGSSTFLLKLKSEGKENGYNRDYELWLEYGSFYGHLIGFINGIFFFIADKSFF